MDEDIQNVEIDSIQVSGFVRKGTENVFTIEVSWSNDCNIEISRRYSDFVAFHRVLLNRCRGNHDYPMLPTFGDLFENAFGDENNQALCQPKIHLFNDYCSFLNECDNYLVKSFFECTKYDSTLRQRPIVSKSPEYSNLFAGLSHKYLVLMDYCSNGTATFSVKAGDIVVWLGQDKQDWSLIALKRKGKLQFDWLPTIYLLEMEGENDPLVKDLITYFNEANDGRLSNNDDMSLQCSDSQCSLSSGGGSFDLMNEGMSYYILSEDCHILCSFTDNVLITRGDKVLVIDKDTDGWWYVCSSNGDEGWLPSTVLEPQGTSLRKGKGELDVIHYPSNAFDRPQTSCHASKSYRANQFDELSIRAGDWVNVLYESPSGWWTVRFHGNVGLFPGIYLTKKPDTVTFLSFRTASYSIGFNASHLSEPPPRREAYLLTSSPISLPPAIIEDAILSESRLYNYNQETIRESSSATASPQPMTFLNDVSSMSEGEECYSSQRNNYTLPQLSTLVNDNNSLQQLSLDTVSPIFDGSNSAELSPLTGSTDDVNNNRTFSAVIIEQKTDSLVPDSFVPLQPSIISQIGSQHGCLDISAHQSITPNQYTELSSSFSQSLNDSTVMSKSVSFSTNDIDHSVK